MSISSVRSGCVGRADRLLGSMPLKVSPFFGRARKGAILSAAGLYATVFWCVVV